MGYYGILLGYDRIWLGYYEILSDIIGILLDITDITTRFVNTMWTHGFSTSVFCHLVYHLLPLLKGDRVWSRFICCSSRGHANGWKSLWLDVVFNLLYVLAMTMPTAATMINMSRCWIHTYESLVGGLELFLFVHSVGNNHPNWITHIFQRGRLKPPTIYIYIYTICYNPIIEPYITTIIGIITYYNQILINWTRYL